MSSKARLTLLPLSCVMYLIVSGGPYGIEDAVGTAGPRLALILCLLVPFTLSLPTALMAAELTAVLPLEGGFYFWVKEALGPFAGFAEAYLTTIYTAVDAAIYPVLFVTYISSVFPISAIAQAALAIALVWSCGLLNAMGVRPVGYTAMLWVAGVAAPFMVLIALGLPSLWHWHLPSEIPTGDSLITRLAMALTVVIWNFCGWENLSVVAAEIENPQRNYLRAIAVALPAVVLGYILPVLVCVLNTKGGSAWHTGSFADLGVQIGGHWLGDAIALGGSLSSFAIFEAAMLWVSRLPFVLASENYLPPSMAETSVRRDIPGRSLLACCIVFTFLIPLGFMTLVMFDVFFYMAGLTLEMAALIRLRRLYPRRNGLFVIGGGRVTVYLVAFAPLLTWLGTAGLAGQQGAHHLIIASLLLVLSWPLYRILRRRYGGPTPVTVPHPSSA
ncbi:MAG: APC family permease [Deltaproteobacteria bacterium]|nr:APC family permease [Deltaproteobacteria bacterium]